MDIREKILEDRENRVDLVRERLGDNNLIVTLKVNIVGNDKNIDGARAILDFFKNKLARRLEVVSATFIPSYDGNYYLIELPRLDYIETKKKLIALEEERLGRLVDIDLFSNMKRSVSRVDLGLEPRKCMVCGRLYNICLRERAHTLDEVLVKTKELIREGLVDILLDYVGESILEEVSAHPKFGLVTRESTGSHSDMNYNTFVKSEKALKESMRRYLEEGFEVDEDTFSNLRKIGLKAERDMFQATNGINTHKGAIFLLGFLLPALVDTLYYNREISSIGSTVSRLASSILDDFKGVEGKKDLTYGEKIYIDHKITGVRGIVYNGLDVLVENVLEIGKYSNLEKDENVIRLLLFFMKEIDDTTLLHRNPIEVLKEVKETSLELYKEELDYERIHEVTSSFVKRRISPGGSADMVILALILQKVVKNFGKEVI